jgi:hypothetical protein
MLESIAIFIGFAYNYHLQNPFSTYGEGSFLALQNFIIMSLMLILSKKYFALGVVTVLHAAFSYSLYNQDIITMAMLNQLQFAAMVHHFNKVHLTRQQTASNLVKLFGQVNGSTLIRIMLPSVCRNPCTSLHDAAGSQRCYHLVLHCSIDFP